MRLEKVLIKSMELLPEFCLFLELFDSHIPVVYALQSVVLDVAKTLQNVKCILQSLKSHKKVTDKITREATLVAEKIPPEDGITQSHALFGNNHPA